MRGSLYAPYTAVDEFKKQSYGDDGMHQKMYEMSTQNGKTTLQLNPIGGSENFQGGSKMSIDDWRYNDQKMKVREQALKILLSKFGGQMDGVVPKYSSQSIYECANDWVSQGNMHNIGIVQYYKAYYAKSN